RLRFALNYGDRVLHRFGAIGGGRPCRWLAEEDWTRAWLRRSPRQQKRGGRLGGRGGPAVLSPAGGGILVEARTARPRAVRPSISARTEIWPPRSAMF